ncbi:MAG: universal stress protein [Thermodesulfobacteriota bacterium]
MKQLEKILVATDFEQASEDALRMSLVFAKQFDSEITLIHVIPEMKDYPIARDQIRKKVTDRLKHMEMDVKRRGITSVETVARFGIPFERIMEHADDLDVNLIVVGSGGKEKRYPLGVTAERVVIAANKPVLVVKRGARAFIRRILCPVDFSETSRRALKNGIHLSKIFQAHLTVLTVFEPLLSSYFGIGRTPGESKEKALVRRQQQEFDRFLRGFHLNHLDWKQVIRRGKPHQEILGAIDETKSDLLLMGSMGKTGLSRMLMGSTTERVVREMPCSVITLKEEHLFRFPLEKEVVNIEKHFRKGKDLLGKQLTEGALAQFEYCIRKDPFFIPAWEAMAMAHLQMGQEKKAKRSKEMAEYIRQHLWEEEIERSE